MALKRAGLQPVGTQPTYAKTSGRNAYAGYGSKTTETDEEKKGLDPGAVNAGILGAMAAKSGYDWADGKGYLDPMKEKWAEWTTPNSTDPRAVGNSYSSANPMADFYDGMDAPGGGNINMAGNGPWANGGGSFAGGAAGTGYGNAAMNLGADYANAGANAAMSANTGMQAANAATQAGTEAAELMPWMMTAL